MSAYYELDMNENERNRKESGVCRTPPLKQHRKKLKRKKNVGTFYWFKSKKKI